jgi:NitT/TauT family transport system substrate-binding protein
MTHFPHLMAISVLALALTGGCHQPELSKAAQPDQRVGASPTAQPPAAAAAPTARLADEAPGPAATPATLPPLRIAYSDWPGWVAWEIAIQKGWFKQAGVDVDFKWFDYVPSMDAFSAGKVDAVCMTNGDALVTGSVGAKNISILINDYSDGNDMIVARPGITTVAQLKGKTVGVEVGFIDHLLLLFALESAHLRPQDVKLRNIKTDQVAQELKSHSVDAIAAWQPNSGAALKEVPGSMAIFTSHDVPGLVYDVLSVSPQSLAERRADWVKVARVWDRVAAFVNDPASFDEAARIMGPRVGLNANYYASLIKGTHIMGLAESQRAWTKAEGLTSIHGSNRIVDAFNVMQTVYKKPEPVDDYLDPSITAEALGH